MHIVKGNISIESKMKAPIYLNAQQHPLDVINPIWIKGPLLTYIWNGCYLPINRFCQPFVRFTKYIWMIALAIIIAINFPRNDWNMSIRILNCCKEFQWYRQNYFLINWLLKEEPNKTPHIGKM